LKSKEKWQKEHNSRLEWFEKNKKSWQEKIDYWQGRIDTETSSYEEYKQNFKKWSDLGKEIYKNMTIEEKLSFLESHGYWKTWKKLKEKIKQEQEEDRLF
jgi:hypothetical protein